MTAARCHRAARTARARCAPVLGAPISTGGAALPLERTSGATGQFEVTSHDLARARARARPFSREAAVQRLAAYSAGSADVSASAESRGADASGQDGTLSAAPAMSCSICQDYFQAKQWPTSSAATSFTSSASMSRWRPRRQNGAGLSALPPAGRSLLPGGVHATTASGLASGTRLVDHVVERRVRKRPAVVARAQPRPACGSLPRCHSVAGRPAVDHHRPRRVDKPTWREIGPLVGNACVEAGHLPANWHRRRGSRGSVMAIRTPDGSSLVPSPCRPMPALPECTSSQNPWCGEAVPTFPAYWA